MDSSDDRSYAQVAAERADLPSHDLPGTSSPGHEQDQPQDPALAEPSSPKLIIVSSPKPAKRAHFEPAPGGDESDARSGSATAPEGDSGAPTNSETPLPPTAPRLPRLDLQHTAQDLKTLIKSLIFLPQFVRRLRVFIPTPIRRLGTTAIRLLAMVLHAQGLIASNIAYDCCVFLWRQVINAFFRQITPRSAYKIPKAGDGGVLFVAGPHHNQVRITLRHLCACSETLMELMNCCAYSHPRTQTPNCPSLRVCSSWTRSCS